MAEERKLRLLPQGEIGFIPYSGEGVFVHGFICNNCGLHFNVYSQKADRHRVINTHCPGCGKIGNFVHFRATLSESATTDLFGLYKESLLVDDSIIPQ